MDTPYHGASTREPEGTRTFGMSPKSSSSKSTQCCGDNWLPFVGAIEYYVVIDPGDLAMVRRVQSEDFDARVSCLESINLFFSRLFRCCMADNLCHGRQMVNRAGLEPATR